MEIKEGKFEHFTNNSIPTPADQEDVTSTDYVSEAISEIIDNVAEELTNSSHISKESTKQMIGRNVSETKGK